MTLCTVSVNKISKLFRDIPEEKHVHKKILTRDSF